MRLNKLFFFACCIVLILSCNQAKDTAGYKYVRFHFKEKYTDCLLIASESSGYLVRDGSLYHLSNNGLQCDHLYSFPDSLSFKIHANFTLSDSLIFGVCRDKRAGFRYANMRTFIFDLSDNSLCVGQDLYTGLGNVDIHGDTLAFALGNPYSMSLDSLYVCVKMDKKMREYSKEYLDFCPEQMLGGYMADSKDILIRFQDSLGINLPKAFHGTKDGYMFAETKNGRFAKRTTIVYWYDKRSDTVSETYRIDGLAMSIANRLHDDGWVQLNVIGKDGTHSLLSLDGGHSWEQVTIPLKYKGATILPNSRTIVYW